MPVVHVIPDEWGPFVDIRACYQSLARRNIDPRRLHDTVYVMTPDMFDRVAASFGSDVLAIIWAPHTNPQPLFLRQRGIDCFVAAVYSEAFDEDESKMLPEHLAQWLMFKQRASQYDAVFVHTPWMRDQLAKRLSCPVFVMPVGWDAEAMGAPRWDTPKHFKIIYWGSRVGRRETIIPELAEQFRVPDEFAISTGRFGRGLLGHLDTSAIALYLAHSPVRSFSTWRLWQVASTSAVMVAEPGDSWPFIPDEHYVEISPIEVQTVRSAARVLLDLANNTRVQYAKNAHELARKFTVDYVHEAYVLPAFEQIRSRG